MKKIAIVFSLVAFALIMSLSSCQKVPSVADTSWITSWSDEYDCIVNFVGASKVTANLQSKTGKANGSSCSGSYSETADGSYIQFENLSVLTYQFFFAQFDGRKTMIVTCWNTRESHEVTHEFTFTRQ